MNERPDSAAGPPDDEKEKPDRLVESEHGTESEDLPKPSGDDPGGDAGDDDKEDDGPGNQEMRGKPKP